MDPKDVEASLIARFQMKPDLAGRVAKNLLAGGDWAGYPGVQEDAVKQSRIRRFDQLKADVSAGNQVSAEDYEWLRQVHERTKAGIAKADKAAYDVYGHAGNNPAIREFAGGISRGAHGRPLDAPIQRAPVKDATDLALRLTEPYYSYHANQNTEMPQPSDAVRGVWEGLPAGQYQASHPAAPAVEGLPPETVHALMTMFRSK